MSWRTLCVLSLLSSLVGTEMLITSSSVSPSEVDGLIWRYLLDKYSTSGDSLSPTDVATMVKSMSKCPETVDEPSSKKPLTTNKTSSMRCNGIPLLNSNSSSQTTFANLSSLMVISHKLLFFADNPACCDSDKLAVSPQQSGGDDRLEGSNFIEVTDAKSTRKEKPTSGEVWGYGILCVTLISMCSLAGVSVMPFMKKEFYKNLLTALVGLAVGSLTGSAVFHLIPQAFDLSANDPSHEYLFIALMVCGGIWMFFMLERILKFIMDYKDRKDRTMNREKIPSVVSSTSPENNSAISMLVENGNCIKISDLANLSNGSMGCNSPISEPEVVYECQEQAIKASFGHQERPRLTSFHDHSLKFEQGKDSVIATVAYMIIFGDGLHNFIDGLSIGAAFNESILTGVSISMAVFCEELPHELGDFAVLLNAGMSIRQALTYNFLSACTCYIGMAVGILLGEIEASTYIFALAGGMFLYIALVDMVPEMNEIAEETSKVSVKKGMWILFLQNIGLFAGITALFILAKYQDHIHF